MSSSAPPKGRAPGPPEATSQSADVAASAVAASAVSARAAELSTVDASAKNARAATAVMAAVAVAAATATNTGNANVTTTHQPARPRTLSTPPAGLDVRTSQALATVTAQMRPSPRDVQEVDSDEIGFVLELARALHRYGTPAHRLEEAIGVVCRRLELAVEVFSTPTTIIMSFGNPAELRTRMLRVDTGELNMSKLAAVDELADAVVAQEISAGDGITRLAEIMGRAPQFGAVATLAASGVAAGGLAVFFGGGWREVVAAATIGLLLGVLRVGVTLSTERAHMFELLGATVAAFMAAAAAHVFTPLSPSLVTIAALIVLLPGMTLTVAMTELATKNMISGTARLMSSLIALLQLVVGVALGERVAVAFWKTSNLKPVVLDEYAQWIALILSAIAVAVLAKARPRVFGWIISACAVGYIGTRYGSRWLGPQLGVLVGALALGCLGNLYARLLHRTAQVVLVPAVLLLVPGSLGFRGMNAILARDTVSGVDTMFAMFISATALVGGLLLANAVVSPRRVL